MPAAFLARSPPPSTVRETSSSRRASSTTSIVAVGWIENKEACIRTDQKCPFFNTLERKRHSKEHHHPADLALLDSLLQGFTLTGAISSAFPRASNRWQERLDYASCPKVGLRI